MTNPESSSSYDPSFFNEISKKNAEYRFWEILKDHTVGLMPKEIAAQYVADLIEVNNALEAELTAQTSETPKEHSASPTDPEVDVDTDEDLQAKIDREKNKLFFDSLENLSALIEYLDSLDTFAWLSLDYSVKDNDEEGEERSLADKMYAIRLAASTLEERYVKLIDSPEEYDFNEDS